MSAIQTERHTNLLVLVGPSAGGKSTTARIVARRLGWALGDVDEEVKTLPEASKLLDLNSPTSPNSILRRSVMKAGYEKMYRSTEDHINSGQSVVLAATHRSPESHDNVRGIISRTGARLIIAELTAPIECLTMRVSQRGPDHPSGVKSEEALREELSEFHRFTNPDPSLTVDTSTVPPWRVASMVIDLVTSNT